MIDKLKHYIKIALTWLQTVLNVVRHLKIWQHFKGFSDTFNALSPIRQTIWMGFGIIFFFFFILGTWASFAQLDAAAVAEGKVISASYRKTVQHLEGGIIKKINVKEGSHVKNGDVLIVLEDTQAKASYDATRKQVDELLATEARLIALRDGKDKIIFPERLLENEDIPEVKKIMETQRANFEADKRTLNGQLEILQQRIEQLKDEIDSLKAQVRSSDAQLVLAEKEISAMRVLDEKALIEKTRLWSIERESARIEGNRGEKLALIARAQQKIGETQQQILTTKDENLRETLKELRDTQVKLSELYEKERASEDVFTRTKIIATQDGIVVNLQQHTIGGVIKPGEDILEIVPAEDSLVIEARANPLDIDVIKPGLPARVQLVAFKQRSTPQLEGEVTHISADIFQDEKTQESYYRVYVKVEPEEFKKLNDESIKLYPGMPVQVMIVTGSRTPMSYLLSPISDSFHRAFREE